MEFLNNAYLQTLDTSQLWRLVYVSDQYRLFRRTVRKKFKYTCNACHKPASRNKKIHVHHLFPKAKFPQFTFDVSKAELLCRKCHLAAHDQIRAEHPEYSDLPSATPKILIQFIHCLTFQFYAKKLARYSRRRWRKRR